MKLRYLAYAAFIAGAAGAFALGSSGPSEAKAKKMMAPPPHPGPCLEAYAPVCGVKGGMKFTYGNSCYAGKDGASIVANKACPAKKAKKQGKKHGKKKAHAMKKKAMKK
jgi:hypothetical protein